MVLCRYAYTVLYDEFQRWGIAYFHKIPVSSRNNQDSTSWSTITIPRFTSTLYVDIAKIHPSWESRTWSQNVVSHQVVGGKKRAMITVPCYEHMRAVPVCGSPSCRLGSVPAMPQLFTYSPTHLPVVSLLSSKLERYEEFLVFQAGQRTRGLKCSVHWFHGCKFLWKGMARSK